MIATTTPTFIVLALGCLILSYFAFRSNAGTAVHGTRQKLQMAAIWFASIVGLTFLIRQFG